MILILSLGFIASIQQSSWAGESLLVEDSKCEFRHAYYPGEIDKVFGEIFVDETGAAIEGSDQKNSFTVFRQKEQSILNRARQTLCNYAFTKNEMDLRLAQETGTGRYPPDAYEKDTDALAREVEHKLQSFYKEEKEILSQIERKRVEKAKDDKDFRFKIGGLPMVENLLNIQNTSLEKAKKETLTWRHIDFTKLRDAELKDRLRQARNGLFNPILFNEKGQRVARNKSETELKKSEETGAFASNESKIKKYNAKLASVTHATRSPSNEETQKTELTEDQLKNMPKEQVQTILKDQLMTLSQELVEVIKDKLSEEQQTWLKTTQTN